MKKIDLEKLPHISFKSNGDVAKPDNHVDNFKYLLDFYDISVNYNEITKSTSITFNDKKLYPDDNYDNAEACKLELLKSLCEINSINIFRINEQLNYIASKNPINPIIDYCCLKPWDGVDRINDILNTIIVDPSVEEWKNTSVTKFFYSAIGAALNSLESAFAFKSILVMQGKQGLGKTPWIKILTGDMKQHFLQGHYINPEIKDSVIQSTNYWIVELGELDSITKKSDEARLKAFIDKPFDEIRLPYAPKTDKYPRRTVYFGTVNPQTFLTDQTGNSRYWCVPVKSLNLDALDKIDKQQFWAQIYKLVLENTTNNVYPYPWQLSAEENSSQELINKVFLSMSPIEEAFQSVFKDEENIPSEKFKEIWIANATQVLTILGWDKTRVSPKDKQSLEIMLNQYFGDKKVYSGVRGYFFTKPLNWKSDQMTALGMRKTKKTGI